jgi:hypothetical protein
MTRLGSLRLVSLAAVAPLLAAGCGGPALQPVSGQVHADGKPAVGATVMFYPDGPADVNARPAAGVCAADGTFTLSTGTEGGVAPGKYLVTVVWPNPNVKLTDAQRMAGANPNDAPDVFKGKYANRETSKLTAEVKAGVSQVEPFHLK